MDGDIAAWLRDLDLAQYEQAFRENAVDCEVLPELTDADLEKLGVLLGHRRRMLRAIAAITKPVTSPAAAPVVPARVAGAERRQVTIMFCDLVGSTSLSARLDPEDLREVLGAYNALVAEVVGHFEGSVNRYMGDGVLTCFGYPQAHEDDAERAIRTALLLIDKISQLKFPAGNLEVRVGIVTGLVVIGDLIGTGDAQERGVVGETPNLAFRLQGLASPNSILISESTRRLVGTFFEYRDLGSVEIKGFSAKVPIWQVLRPSPVASRFEALHASSLTPFIGRGEEVELLLRLWERAKDGEGQIVQITGEAGIGKSRVVAALQEKIHGDPNIRLSFFCSAHHSGSTLYPVIAHLERAAGFGREDAFTTKLDKLEALLSRSVSNPIESISLFADLLGLPVDDRCPPIALDPQERRELILAASLRHLEGLARKRPVLLICEDVHWVDSTTLELLEMVTDRVPHLPVLLVVTSRPEFQPHWTGRPHVSTLMLSRLDRRETAALVAHVAGDKVLPSELIARIVERTDGIPLFAEELTKTLLESNLLRKDHDRYLLDRPMLQLTIPTSLHASLMARLDRLSLGVREVAQVGAALGREFSYEILGAIALHTGDQLQRALNELAGAGLILYRGIAPSATLIFKHALIQDAAYGTMLRSERHELHQRIARTLETRFPDIVATQPEVMAHHYTEAGLLEEAIDYWRKAGERAIRRSANVEAVRHLTRGIELTHSLPPTPERDRRELRLYLSLGPAMRALRGHATEELLDVYSRARDLLNEDATVREQISVLYGLWILHFTRWDAGAYELAQQIIQLSARNRDPEVPTLGQALMGNTLWARGTFDDARAYLERSLELCEAGSNNDTNARTLNNHGVAVLSFLGVTLWPLGYLEKAAQAAERALAQARHTGHVPLTAMALHNQAFLVASFGVDRHLMSIDPREAESYCVEHGVAAYEPWARFWQGLVLARGHNPQHGIEIMRGAMDAAQNIGAGLFRSVHLGHLGSAYASLGEPDTGIDLLGQAIRTAETTNAGFFAAELYRLRGDLLAQLGRPYEAEADLRRGLKIARQQQAHLWELRAATSIARMQFDQGRCAEGLDLLAPVYQWFTEGFDTADLTAARSLLDKLRAGAQAQA